MNKLLKKIGLTDSEIKLYLATLKGGPVTITGLSKLAQLKRTSIYSQVEKLKQLGLLNTLKINKRRVYKAGGVKALVTLIENNQQKWQSYKKEIEELLPEFEKMQSKKDLLPNIHVFEGLGNFPVVREEFFKQLKKSPSFCQIGDAEALSELLPQEFFQKLMTNRRRQFKKGTKIYVISDKYPIHQIHAVQDEKNFREYRFTKDRLDQKSVIIICSNTVWLAKLSHPYICISIESKEIADLIRFMWQSIWDKLPYRTFRKTFPISINSIIKH